MELLLILIIVSNSILLGIYLSDWSLLKASQREVAMLDRQLSASTSDKIRQHQELSVSIYHAWHENARLKTKLSLICSTIRKMKGRPGVRSYNF